MRGGDDADPGSNRMPPIFPLLLGTSERRSHDYQRCGTTSLFAARNLANGEVVGSLRWHPRTQKIKQFLEQLEAKVSATAEAHLVLDKYAAPQNLPIQRWRIRHSCFHRCFTPTSSSC